ncbi:MAG: hypothetical protein CVU38_13920 [Chloroflexi bacterium HGW-Chloroflexi-1]|nr:MAG: hypothetical protein CVU38_13920 [Chloroflexi bacterium HGW-Chloroflexi-1]
MITAMHIRNFKSWADTGEMRLAPITGLFGANSSGKTSILQFLLLLKQTVDIKDRQRVLHLGDERSLINLGSFHNILHRHQLERSLDFELRWQPQGALLSGPLARPALRETKAAIPADEISFSATIRAIRAGELDVMQVERFTYRFRERVLGVAPGYRLVAEGYPNREVMEATSNLPAPDRFYGFPREVDTRYGKTGDFEDFSSEFERLFDRLYYLGPLREYPHRSYLWTGAVPGDVGARGEGAIPALIAARTRNGSMDSAVAPVVRPVEQCVAEWLKRLGLISDFTLQSVTPSAREYEVKVRQTGESAEVLITDVGFGVSQVLPVLVLCYYAPEGSILLLEQPEIHLHPAVQAGLADVFAEVVKERRIQIILESHSEHLLRRLQRRVAEEKLRPEQVALYFTTIGNGASRLERLQLDSFGNITNWPQDFFGDEMGELVAMSEAEMRRKQAGKAAQPA